MIQLLPDFREFLSLLNSSAVRYLVVGGYAVAFHGHPRATGDLDVWIAIDAENLQRARTALLQFGFSEASIPPELFERGNSILRIGRAPVRIELLSAISGVEFESCYSRSIACNVDGVDARFIARPDLIANKRAAGRLKDLADAAELSPPIATPRRKRPRKPS